MKKQNDTNELEEYLEAHASELVETDDDLEEFIGAAKKDNDERRARAANLQSLRKNKLKMSQSELAKAVGANVRTLQGWETGRQDYPKSVEILMRLMNRMPNVKRELLSEASGKEARPPVMKRRKKMGSTKLAQSTKKQP